MKIPTEINKILDWAKETSFAVTVCDRKGVIIYMNNKSKLSFAKRGDIMGCNLKDCHSEESWEHICRMINTGESNTYTYSRKGVNRFIHQTPWYKTVGVCKEIAGLVEISIEIPQDLPHFVR